MTSEGEHLAPSERRALLRGSLYRVLGTPIVAVLGLANTAIIVRETGEEVFGLVSLVSTLTLLFPFLDFGVGATVTNASAQLTGPDRNPSAVYVVRQGYRVLFRVAATMVLLILFVMAVDGWSFFTGFSSGSQDRWAITVAACLFALTIPANLSIRILIGIDHNPSATLVTMSGPVFALIITLMMAPYEVAGIWYAVSSLAGLLIGLCIGTVVALRLSGLGRSAFAPVPPNVNKRGLLAGSGWMFIAAVGVPAGLQTGRLVLGHLSTPIELSRYALMAQFYAVGWTVLATAGFAYWPVFVRRRGATEETLRMWWRLTAAFAAVAVIEAAAMMVLGPWAATVLSGGQIDVSVGLAVAFGALLVAQAVFFPAQMMLTQPNEARWRAITALLMAGISVGVAVAVAPQFGAVGVVCAAAIGTLFAQIIPAALWVPRLVRLRRPASTEAT